jgi:tetratricopeptide (TPR) repeat protein
MTEKKRNRLRVGLISLALALATAAVYWQVQGHEFINLDDPDYVSDNQQVLNGLTWNGLVWAFTSAHAANWHPLTWLSLMLDCELSKSTARACHTTNMLLHIANTLLLFWVLKKMTGAVWRSAFVAALFALHPLHVESVAWVSERKDVLSTFFWLLTMWTYASYIKRPGVKRYLVVSLVFALGLMAKPMLVTLPFVLLLLDWWPLERFALDDCGNVRKPALHLIVEKIPLFALTVISCVVTYLAQRGYGAVWEVPLILRIPNVFVSHLRYIQKMIWPSRLAVFYPYIPGNVLLGEAAVAAFLILLVSLRVARAARSHKYLPVGWLWYLGTLVPVIGLVQVGSQAMADRYTYVPLIGLFIMIAWGAADYAKSKNLSNIVFWLPAFAVLVVMAVCTWQQIGYWQNSTRLYEHALSVTTNNYFAHMNLGRLLKEKGETDKALTHYEQVLKNIPTHSDTHHRMVDILIAKGQAAEAITHCKEILQRDPNDRLAHMNLAIALEMQGNLDDATAHYEKAEALELRPDYSWAYINVGVALGKQGKLTEAVRHFRRVLLIQPDSAPAHYNLAVALDSLGEFDEAIKHCRQAIQLDPDNIRLQNWLKAALEKRNKSTKQD